MLKICSKRKTLNGKFPDLVESIIFYGFLIRILIWILILTLFYAKQNREIFNRYYM